MRQQYRYKQLGKKSSLTDERIALLNTIGFVWKMQGGRRRKSDPVARPNQGTSSPTSEAAPVVSPPTSVQKRMSFVVDPMSTVIGGVRSAVAASAAGYIPPNMPSSLGKGPQHSIRGLPYQPKQHASI